MGNEGSAAKKEIWDPMSVGLRSFAYPISVPPSKGVLLVNEKMCAGCASCVYACSLSHEGVAAPHLSRIKVSNLDHEEWDNTAKPCLQCVEPLCLRYCPVGAIYVDGTTGARVIDQEKCIGCAECARHCPYRCIKHPKHGCNATTPRIAYDDVLKKAIKCDLCGGDPECVKSCPFGALTYYTNPDGVMSGYLGEGEF
jgi:Fe-S-cluster-containing hydrogenase component 2